MQAGQVQRRRDTRERLVLYLQAFNAWATDEPITRLRYNRRESVAPVAKLS